MSILEIAKLAGVSHMTVARVINNEDSVSLETAAKIKAIMKKVGYIPKPPNQRRGPRRMSTSSITTGNVAFLTAHEEGFRVISSSPVMNSVFHGVEESLSFQGMNLIQGVISSNRGLPPIVKEGLVDGVIVWPDMNGASSEVLESLKKINIVYLMSGNNYMLPGDKVMPNNSQIGKLAAEYLVKKGHKNISFVTITSQHEKTMTMGKRWESFSKTASRLGAIPHLLAIEQKDELNFEGFGIDGPVQAKLSAALGDCNTVPSGIFICFDSLTATLYPLLHKIGIRPGRDIEILSCNNEKSFLTGLDPMPLSVDIQPELIGKRAVEQLLWRAGHPDDESEIVIEVTPELLI